MFNKHKVASNLKEKKNSSYLFNDLINWRVPKLTGLWKYRFERVHGFIATNNSCPHWFQHSVRHWYLRLFGIILWNLSSSQNLKLLVRSLADWYISLVAVFLLERNLQSLLDVFLLSAPWFHEIWILL